MLIRQPLFVSYAVSTVLLALVPKQVIAKHAIILSILMINILASISAAPTGDMSIQ